MSGRGARQGSRLVVRPTALDRPWRESFAVLVIGPLDLPAPDRVADALARLRACGPAARVGLTVTDSGRSLAWEPQPRATDVQVRRTDPATDDEALARATAWVTEQGPGPPDRVRLLVMGRWLAACYPHVLGDARFMVNVLTAVVAMSHGAAPPSWALADAGGRPLLAAAREHLGLRPGPWWQAARSARPRLPARGASEAATPFVPHRMSVHARSDADATARLRDWRRRHAPGVSTVAVQFAAARRALDLAGLEVAGNPHVLVDLRRYLPAGHSVTGNFVVGLDLPVDDPRDPAAVAVAMDTATASGRPLTAAAASAVLARMHRRSRPPAQPVLGSAVRLALTHIGRPLAIGRLPWSETKDQRTFAGALDPPGPTGLTLGMAEVGPVLQVTASFHRNVIDPESVREALRLLAHEPAALLEDRRPARTARP